MDLRGADLSKVRIEALEALERVGRLHHAGRAR